MEAIRDFLLPPAKTAVAEQYDLLFNFVHISSLVLTVAILIALAYLVIKYRRRDENEVTPVITHNNKLEITWSVIPLILVIIIFGWGFKTFMTMTTPPDDAYEVHVTGQKWIWQFSYQNGAQTTGELHVPAGRPVKLIMSSNDVIHSFFVPDFRIKQDVVPNRYTQLWFQVDEPDTSQVFCTEYCGTAHSDMMAKVIVHEEKEFETWLANNQGGSESGPPSDLTMAEWGEQIAQQNACMTCHSTDGSRLVGPSWKGTFGSEQPLQDGSTVTADENYIRESILNPGAKIVQGFQNQMPPYQGTLSDEQINAIIEYLKTLK